MTVAALAIAVALLAAAPVADAGKGGPSITLDEVTIGGPVGLGFCAGTIKYTVSGLKGSPSKSWGLGVITSGRFNRGTGPEGGGFGTIMKSSNGQQQTHEFTEGLIFVNTTFSTDEDWDLRLFLVDSKTGAKIALSNFQSVTIAAGTDCTPV